MLKSDKTLILFGISFLVFTCSLPILATHFCVANRIMFGVDLFAIYAALFFMLHFQRKYDLQRLNGE